MKLKKTKKDIIESIKSVSSKKKNEMFEVDSKVQAVASPSFVDALEMSAKNKQRVIDRMKEKEKERKEFMKQTVERTANRTPKTDDMKKMKMIEKFIKESFKDKLTINENIFTVTTKSRAELKKLIENARKHEVKYTIERINEEYRFNYKFESLNKKLNEERKYVAGFFSKGKKDSYTEMSSEKWKSLDSDVKVKDLLDMWWNSVRIKGKGIKGEALLYKDCHDGSYELDEEHNSHGEDILNMTVHTHSEYDEDGDGYPIIYAKLLSKDKKLTVEKAKNIAYDKLSYGDYKNLMTMDDDYIIDYVSTELVEDKDDKRFKCEDGKMRTQAEYEKWIKHLKELHEIEEGDLTADELRALENAGALDESKEIKESIDNGHFWAIVYKQIGDDVEQNEIYDDFDDARADFKYMVQENPKDYEYAVFQEVTIEDGVEDITIIDELRDGELVESKILKEEYSLQRSPYKDIIGRHFNYSVDFEFLDIIALILDRIDFEGDLEDEIDVAIDDSLIYIEDQWTVAKFYAPSPADLDWDEVLLNGLSVDIHVIAEEIIATKED